MILLQIFAAAAAAAGLSFFSGIIFTPFDEKQTI